MRDSAASEKRRPTFDQQISRMARAKGSREEAATEAAINGDAELDHTAGSDVPAGLWLVKDDGIYLIEQRRPDWRPGRGLRQGV